MSTSSDNASIKDLVNPLMIIAKSVTDNNKSENNPFKEVKAVANYFFNGIKESIRNDEKLTNYRQFFSEINAIDKKIATLNGVSDSSKLDTLVELEKTGATISTGILKTTLEIKDALNNLFYMVGSSSHKEEFSLVKMILGAIGAGSSAMTVADGFGKSKNPKLKARVGVAAIGAYAFDYLSDHLQSNFDKGSWQHHIGGSLQDLADSMALAIVPHPVAWIAAAGMFIGKTANRYFPEEIEALNQFAASVLSEYEKFKAELKEKLLRPIKDVYNNFQQGRVKAYDWAIGLKDDVSELPEKLNKYALESIESINGSFQKYTTTGKDWISGVWDNFLNSVEGIGDRVDRMVGSNLNMLQGVNYEPASKEQVTLGRPKNQSFNDFLKVDYADLQNIFLNSLKRLPEGCFDLSAYTPTYESSTSNSYQSTNTFHNTFVLPQGTTLEQAKEVSGHLSQQREITQELNGGAS